MSEIEIHEFNGVQIEQRQQDGYIDATAMCQASGKLLGHYMENQATKEFLEALSLNIGIPIIRNSKGANLAPLELVQSKPGRYGGTWVHPYVAINLAQWCSPQFAVFVSKLVFEWFNAGMPQISQAPEFDRELRLKELEVKLERAKARQMKLELERLKLSSPAPDKPSSQRRTKLLRKIKLSGTNKPGIETIERIADLLPLYDGLTAKQIADLTGISASYARRTLAVMERLRLAERRRGRSEQGGAVYVYINGQQKNDRPSPRDDRR